MHWVDWLIVFIPVLVVAYIGFKTQKYVKGVSDFLTAGRVAGRYVVAVASGEAAMGLVSLVAMFEAYYNSGFAYSFWSGIATPIMIVLLLSGYCIYRFRETRAMTMGQFLEMRYNRSFRIFAGILQSISGILNYAIFPAVGARFLIYFCDLPLEVSIGGWMFPTFALVMAIFLSIAVFVATMGGQITIMVTDCVLGIISYPLYAIVVIYILMKISWWNDMVPALLDRPDGKSMLNPFDIEKLRTFNLFYIIVGIFGNILNRMAWSGTQGYTTAALNAHEQKMGGVIGAWRTGFSRMMIVLLAIAAFTFMHSAMYSARASECKKELAWKAVNDVAPEKKFESVRNNIHNSLNIENLKPSVKGDSLSQQQGTSDNIYSEAYSLLKQEDKAKAQTFKTIFGQMRVPMALKYILPVGITGIFCALCVFLLISTDTTYLHSWGSIIVQDVILPIRGKPFTPKQQLKLLRAMIMIVAMFAFLFSYFFGQVDYILMFFAITGTLWLGGAGSCIVGGLYWKRGTTAAAFTALITGSFIATSGMVLQKIWAPVLYPWISQNGMLKPFTSFIENCSAPFEPIIMWRVTAEKFPINSQEMFFMAMVLSISLYIIVSLLTCKKAFNMERMLHRGKYRREGEQVVKQKLTFETVVQKLVGINSQYSRGDKILAWFVYLWVMLLGFGIFIVTIIWNKFFYTWPAKWWIWKFFITGICIAGFAGAISTVWFTIGGTWDLRRMFKRLKEKQTNILDDGRVIGYVSADDVSLVEEVEHRNITEAHREEDMLEQALEEEQDDEDIENLHDHQKDD